MQSVFSKLVTQQISIDTTSVHILRSFFSSCRTPASGACIFSKSTLFKMIGCTLVDSVCTQLEVTAGGAMRVDAPEIEHSRCCYQNCLNEVGSSHAFCFAMAGLDTAPTEHSFIAINCCPKEAKNLNSCEFAFGKEDISNLNSTNNAVAPTQWGAGLRRLGQNSLPASGKFWNIRDNVGFHIIALNPADNTPFTFTISKCNFIGHSSAATLFLIQYATFSLTESVMIGCPTSIFDMSSVVSVTMTGCTLDAPDTVIAAGVAGKESNSYNLVAPAVSVEMIPERRCAGVGVTLTVQFTLLSFRRRLGLVVLFTFLISS